MIANHDEIDLALIRREWSPVAVGEEERTAWLEKGDRPAGAPRA